MAKVELLAPYIRKWEGGFVNDPADSGGATNMGVTIGTFEVYCHRKGYPRPTVERLKKLTPTDIFRLDVCARQEPAHRFFRQAVLRAARLLLAALRDGGEPAGKASGDVRRGRHHDDRLIRRLSLQEDLSCFHEEC